MRRLRPVVTVAVLLLIWQTVIWVTDLPHYILPGPLAVATAFQRNAGLLTRHAVTTLTEILLGLFFGVALGTLSAVLLASVRAARRWLMPLLVVSQAIPVFALAPLLVLWLGYGMASKIAMATLIIYFPVTSALFDGLRRTEPGWLDLARTMGASGASALWRIRLPAALPALASGVRVAAAVAPIGAVIGEWVGSSAGLGYLMLQANARMRIDLLFAALVVLGVFAVALYTIVDGGLRRALPWLPDSHSLEKD